MQRENLVSVVIPVYNQSRDLQRAIESVKEQSWNDLEIIVIDDGSTEQVHVDGSVRLYQQENRGAASARNEGIKRAKGEYVAFLDADDVWPRERLEQLMRCMLRNQRIDVAIGKIEGEQSWQPHFGATLFRKRVFDTVGLLDETLRYSEDQDWFLRAKEGNAQIIALDEISLLRSVNPKSMTFNKSWNQLDIHRVLKKSLDRRKENVKPLQPLSTYYAPLVSVIIPTYNGEKYLAETIESVLAQTYLNFEIIVIDHGSTDNTAEVVKGYEGIRYLYQEHQGNAHARNTGIRESQGEFVAFIDHDDLWDKEKLSKQMRVLLKDSSIMFTISHFKSFLSPGSDYPRWCRKETFTDPKPDFSPSSLVTRKKVFEVCGMFDENLRIASDIDWFFHANDLNIPMATVPEVLHQRRVHNDNQSNGVANHHAEMLKAIRRSVKRKIVKAGDTNEC